MLKIPVLFLLLAAMASNSSGYAQKQVLYKAVDTTKLYIQIHHPESMDTTKKHPAIVFFYGGGWVNGSMGQLEPHARHFSQRGMICMLVDYRVSERHNTTPFESLKDAKSAIRYVRAHADNLHVDTSKIVAAGASAGGHLAAATAFVDDYNEATDNMSVSCIPDALILFNPVIDNGPGGYGFDRVGEAYKNFSPLHNIKKRAPPTIMFLGTEDVLIPVETARYYQKVMEKVNSICELHLFKGQGHGFFNYQFFEYYEKTVSKADAFLQSLGYLTEEPHVKIK